MTLDVDQIANFTKRPQDVIGTHFFSQANVMKLLEIVRGKATAKDVLATTLALSKKIRKTGVVSSVCDGFIGNRMIEQYSRLAGNDIGWAICKRRYVEKPEVSYSKTADLLCELGCYGQKTDAGWYDYKAGDRKAYPSTVVNDMIVKRLMYAMVNGAAHILEEGIATCASVTGRLAHASLVTRDEFFRSSPKALSIVAWRWCSSKPKTTVPQAITIMLPFSDDERRLGVRQSTCGLTQ